MKNEIYIGDLIERIYSGLYWYALYYGLFSFDDLKQLLINRASHVEVIITGRYAPKELIDMADLVTEMKEIKHYYTKGVEARTGIEK